MASHALDYSSVPEVNPTGAPGGSFHMDVNADQFGGAIARSLGTVGQGLDKASSEAFGVATQQEQMDARTHAAELHSWQADQTTDETEKFLSLKGKAAEMARPDFKNRIEEIHQQALGQANNNYTKQLVNSEGRGLIDRNYAIAARHSATEKKSWEATTAASAADSHRNDAVFYATSSATQNVADDPGVMGSLNKSGLEAMNFWENQGYSGEALSGKVAAARGKGVTEIVKALASDESPTGIKRANDFYKSEMNNIDAGSRIAIQNVLKGPITQLGGQERAKEIIYGPQAPQKPMEIAARFVGADEKAQRDTLTKFIGKVGGQSVDPSVTPWCAAFVNAVLREAGVQGSGSLAARSFLNYGKVVDGKPQEGDVVILSRGDPSAGLGHVGFYAGEGSTPGSIRILAGNQGNKVAYAEYPESQVLGVRRITAADVGQTPQIDMAATRPQITKGEFMQRVMNDPDMMSKPQLMSAALAHGNKIYEADHLIQTQSNAAFTLRMKNSSAEAISTGTVQNPIGHDEFIQNLGPVAGEEAYSDYQKNIQLGADIRSTASLSPEATEKLLNDYAPQPGSDFIGQSKRLESLQKAITQNDAAKKKDPAGFVISGTNAGSASFKQFQTLMNDPKSTPDMKSTYAGMFAGQMIAEQIRLGVDPADARVVPKWYTDDLNKRLTNPATSGGAQNINEILKHEAELWGDHWPDIYRQLAPDTQPIVRVIGAGVKDEAATALINSFKMKEGDLLKNEENPVDTLKTITTAVDANLAPFYSSLSGDKQDQTKTDFRTMATRLATVYLQNNTGMQGEYGITGMSSDVKGNVQESARKAVNDLIGFKYDFRDTYRVPKSSGVSADAVQAGAVAAREMLGRPLQSNLSVAKSAMNLTPQESALYQRHVTNLTGSGGVDNADGSRSSLFVNTFGIDGKTFVIPSVWDGKILKPDESLAKAKAEGLDKFPSYATEKEAQDRYNKMHEYMEKDTAQYRSNASLAIAAKRDDVGALSPEYLATNTANSLRRNGVWLTAPKEQGLVLVQGNGNAVARPDGTAFILTWKQLGDLAAERAKRKPMSDLQGAPIQ